MKKRNPDLILFNFNMWQSAKNTSFFKETSTDIQETKSTHALIFWSKVKAHTPTFMLL